MKQILLTISFLLFTGCVEYTVKVEADDVEINGEGVENGKCVTYTKAFFGWLGDFPLNVKIGEEEGEYEEGNYVISAEVKSTEEACEEDEKVKSAEELEAEAKAKAEAEAKVEAEAETLESSKVTSDHAATNDTYAEAKAKAKAEAEARAKAEAEARAKAEAEARAKAEAEARAKAEAEARAKAEAEARAKAEAEEQSKNRGR